MKTELWRGQKVPIHLSSADHRWQPIRKGFPQMICKCGKIGVRGIDSGDHTITVSPAGQPDIIKFTGSPVPFAPGEFTVLGNDGRPEAFIDQTPQALVGRNEVIGDRKFWSIRNQVGSTTLDQFGIAAPTVNGTPTVIVNVSDGELVQYATAAGANSDAGWLNAASLGLRFDYFPIFEALVKTPADRTNTRIWVGWFSSNPMASDTIPANSFGFRLSITALDGKWTAINSNGVGGVTLTPMGTGNVINDTVYYLTMGRSPQSGNLVFCLADSFQTRIVQVITTTLPTAGVNLLFNTQLRNTAAGSRAWAISHVLSSQQPGYWRNL